MFEVKNSIRDIQFKSIHGTAIGDAIKVSLNLLSSEEKPGVIVLLTDGRENIASSEELSKVVEIAKKNQIIIHSIGIGTKAGGQVPGMGMTSTIDDAALNKIAQTTGGKYSRVESPESLKEVYKEIAISSESKIPIKMRLPLVLLAIFLIFIEWGLLNTKFRSIP
jgi:Ca-activated chloride channel family protein